MIHVVERDHRSPESWTIGALSRSRSALRAGWSVWVMGVSDALADDVVEGLSQDDTEAHHPDLHRKLAAP